MRKILAICSKPSEFDSDSSLHHTRILSASTPFMQASKGPPLATKSKGLDFFRMSDSRLESQVMEHAETVPASSNQSGVRLLLLDNKLCLILKSAYSY